MSIFKIVLQIVAFATCSHKLGSDIISYQTFIQFPTSFELRRNAPFGLKSPLLIPSLFSLPPQRPSILLNTLSFPLDLRIGVDNTIRETESHNSKIQLEAR